MEMRNAFVTGCYFHLCQSIQRKVSELGSKTIYETNDTVPSYIRCLPALAYVPLMDGLDAKPFSAVFFWLHFI